MLRKGGNVCQFQINILKKLILICNRSVLNILASCEKKAYSATRVEKYLHLFDKSRIWLKSVIVVFKFLQTSIVPEYRESVVKVLLEIRII